MITRKTLSDLLDTYIVKDKKTKEVIYYKSPANIGYHTSNEIHDILNTVLSEYGNEEDEITDIEDLRDDINECADSDTPIYYKDIAEWFGGNWTAYDEVKREIGEMGDDIMKGIQMAFCYTLENEAMEALRALYEEAEENEDKKA
jgi:hypothetical protein